MEDDAHGPVHPRLGRQLASGGGLWYSPGLVSPIRQTTERRWLLIQVHRAQIAYILRSGKRRTTSEVAEHMDAIALLCDRGRTARGRALAECLALSERTFTDMATQLLRDWSVERLV